MSAIDSLRTVEDWEGFFDSFKKNLAPVAYEAGPSTAVTQAAETIHPEQTVWARQMAKRIYEPVKGKVYVAVGYQLCSTTMIVGDDGVIIIDPGETDPSAAETMSDFRRFSDKPIKAIVYTHRHPDHAYAFEGTGVTHEDVAAGKVDVIAHESFQHWLINDASIVGPILTARTSLVGFAGYGPTGVIQGALGVPPTPGKRTSHLPTKLVGDVTDFDIAGIKFTAFHAYGDAQDEIDLWFPQFKHIHGSETVQGETFPNLYTLRGTAYRDVEDWREGVDILLGYARGADSYSGSHMRPWVGNDFIVERIINYRDAIQFLHDQSIRHINRGATGPELIELVAQKLPDHLRDDPWLQPYYGTPEHSVRAIYDGTLGWYQGDPTELAAPLHKDKAQRYVEAMGGRDAVIARAKDAIGAGELGWAAELLTHVVRVDTSDTVARELKADALRRWGYQQKNMYWRTLAIGGANELTDQIDYSLTYELQPADVLAAIPATNLIEGLRVRLDADKAREAVFSIGFELSDTGESTALLLRRGVAVVLDTVPDDAVATVRIDSAEVRKLGADLADADKLIKAASAIDGDEGKLREFLGYFDPAPRQPAKLVVR